MSAAPQAPANAAKNPPPPVSSPTAAGGAPMSERPKPGLGSVANTANQILFKNELYTSMKQKTMDQELMAALTRKSQEDEKRRIEKAKFALSRLGNKRKILIGVGDMVGPPGCDPDLYSPASIAVALAPHDTVRDVKKKLIEAAAWKDELPEDFGLFDDASEEPLKDSHTIESALAPGNPASAGRGGRRTGAGWSRSTPSIRFPPPYLGVVWAARLE